MLFLIPGLLSQGLSYVASIALRIWIYVPWFLGYFSSKLAYLLGIILNWVLSPGFTSLSYTNPSGNPIIKVGLSVTQGFVNMLLVLVLIYIAIATILRLAGYETKKLLVTFIVIALLVNFAPVICGLIVDASNIVMNFFVQQLRSDDLGKTIMSKMDNIMDDFNWISDDWTTAVKKAAQVTSLAVIPCALNLVFLFYIVIFIVRYIAIWILVILSPLAFACYILPNTRKFFEQWWQQFLAWSFIGVTCSFFLYLGTLLALNTPNFISTPQTGEEPIFNAFLPLIVPIIFLGIGLIFGLQTSAMGAEAAVGYAKSIGGKTAKGAYRSAYRSSAWAVDQARDKFQQTELGQKAKAAGERLMAAKRWGEGETGVTGFAKRTVDTVNPWRWMKKGAGRLIAGTTTEKTQEKVKKAEDSIKDSDRLPIVLKKYHDAVTDTERLGILNKVVERGDFGDATDKKKFGDAAIDEKEAERMYKRAKGWDSDKTLKKAVPHIAAKYITDEEFAKAQTDDPTIKSKAEMIIRKMKPNDYEKISKESLSDIETVNAMLNNAMGSNINKLIEQHGKIAATALEEGIKRNARYNNFTKPEDWLKKANPKLHKYLTNSPGIGLIEIPQDTKGAVFTASPPPSSGGGPKGKGEIPGLREKEELPTIRGSFKEDNLPTLGDEFSKKRDKK